MDDIQGGDNSSGELTGEPGGEQQQQGGEQQGSRMIPYERFQQVYGPYQEYRKLGDPADVARKLQAFEQWQRQLAQQQQQQARTPEDADKEAIRRRLLEVYPELEQLESIGPMRQAALTAFAKEASTYLNDKLTSGGVKMTPEEQDDFEDLLMAKMTAEEFDAFTNGDISIIDAVLDRATRGGIYGRFRPAPPRPPMRMGPGGKAPQPPQKPNTFDQAGDLAWEKLQAGRQG